MVGVKGISMALRKDEHILKLERKIRANAQIREAFQIFSNLKRQCSRTLAMLLICGMQLILLSAGSSYVRPGPAVGISCCGHGRGERDQMASTSVPPQAKAALLGTRF